MSQQTTLKAVIPYFERFLARFPDPATLAAAPLEDVLELWAGLGYYRRARFLHAAAQRIAAEGLPTDFAGWKSLPGVGDYTAAAIASICFGERVPVIDGNVERVLSRHALIDSDPKKGAGKRAVRAIAEAAIARAESPGDHNQALMELGALLCRPAAAAKCLLCPLRESCQARIQGCVEDLPKLARRPKIKKRLDRAVAIACSLPDDRQGATGERLLYGERPADAVWGGMLELPRVTVEPRESVAASLHRIGAELLDCELERLDPKPIATTRHGVMNESITLEVYAARALSAPSAKGYVGLRPLSAGEAARSALPSPQKSVLEAVFADLRARSHVEAES